jgi:hypothetical protein
MAEIIQVTLESEAADADLAAVAGVFESAGIPVEIEGAYIRHSAQILPWLIEIESSFRYLAAGAAGGAVAAIGTDGWIAVKRLVGCLYEARKGRGDVVLRDPDTRTEVPLPRDLPDEAYQRLSEIEEPRAPQSGILRWDRERRAWIDPLAGLLRCRYPGCTEAAAEGRVQQLSPASMERREFCGPHAAAADLGDDRAWA